MTIDVIAAARDLDDRIIAWRRDIHRHPELGMEEHRTTALIADVLDGAGFEVDRPLETGVVAALDPEGEAEETLAFRADIDALAMDEDNPDLFYRSQTPGVCHACGHDAHTAMLLGLAVLLGANRPALRRRIRLIFQPCEERLPGGARALVEAGAADSVDMIFGLHVDPMLPAGTFEARAGSMMAAADEVRITVRGKGGHGAAPERAVDPIPAAAQLVLALQTVVSRRIEAVEPVVLSICRIHGGSAFNVIPDEVELVGTVRTLSADLRGRMPGLIEETARGVAAAAGAETDVTYLRGHPPPVNDTDAAARLAGSIGRLWGPEPPLAVRPPKMGAEDFSCFLEAVPGAFGYLGVGNPDVGAVEPHHSPRFRIDESVLWMGPALFADLAING